jgi:sigma-B regulation protein RsbU (phosphoserine phosphatase)
MSALSEQGDHAGVDFLAELRHELRTPLNAILGYSELILEDADDDLRALVAGPLGEVIEIARRLLATIDAQMRSRLIETGTISLADLRYAMRTILDGLMNEAGLAKAALGDRPDSETRADVDRIVKAAGRLSDLIDRGLTSTSVASGRIGASRALEATGSEGALPSETSPGRILVADDNPENLDLLTRRLRQQGHDVMGAADGRIALDLLDREPFDLLLLDIMMPHVNGFEVLSVLRAKDRLRDLPVIMISALDDIESVVECLKLGAVDHLPKPFNPIVLNARITASLSVKRLRDKARAYLDQIEAELKIARDIQLMMVPTDFAAADHPPSMSVYGSLSPARRIGGDLYDFFYGADRKLYFFIGDVCGKGIPAALYMTRAKTLFRIIAEQAGRGESAADAASILQRVNRELTRDNPSMMFVTALLGVLDCTTGAVELANAGHPMPVTIRVGGSASMVEVTPGLPLGLMEEHIFGAQDIRLAPGTTLFLYTDGVTDMMDAEDVQFGDERLLEALSVLDEPVPEALVASLAHNLAVHAGATEQFDDITMLALRYLGQPA